MRKWFDKKAKVNLKIYGVINWETKHHNTNIAQYLKKSKQSDDEISSFSRVQRENYFFSKIMQKMRLEVDPDLYFFYKGLRGGRSKSLKRVHLA